MIPSAITRRRRRAAGKDEARERLEGGGVLVAGRLERPDVLLADTKPALALPAGRVERHREVGADVEEVVLDAAEKAGDVVRQARGGGRADGRAGLVDGAVGPDPRGVLGHPRAVAERRLAGVSGARVDAVEAHVCTLSRPPAPGGAIHP